MVCVVPSVSTMCCHMTSNCMQCQPLYLNHTGVDRFFPTIGLWSMGKGAEFARKSRSRMSYSASSRGEKVPTSWKMKQRSYTMAGLRKLGAPWVARLSQSSAPTVERDMGLQNAGFQYQVFETKREFLTHSFKKSWMFLRTNDVDPVPQHESIKRYQEHSNYLVGFRSTKPITYQAWTLQTCIYIFGGPKIEDPLDETCLDDMKGRAF